MSRPGNDEERPSTDRPHVHADPTSTKSPVPAKDDTPDAADTRWRHGVAADIRKRKAASLRLPPLEDGRRDPLQSVKSIGKGDVIAAERAWRHLCDVGLQSELVARVLRGAA